MGSLLRAEWLRIRRRWDVWIIVVGIPALALLAYATSAHSGGNFSIQTVGDVPPELQQQIAAETAAGLALGALPFQFPHSIVTMVQGSMLWLVLGSAFLSASLLGNEFTWGTIRNVVLIRPDRLPYLSARLLTLGGLLLLTFGVVTVMGVLAPLVFHVDPGDPAALSDPSVLGRIGVPLQPIGPVSLGGALVVAGSILMVAVAGMALAGFAALKLKSAATAMLAAGLYAIAEGIVAALMMSRLPENLRFIPQMALTVRITSLIQDAQVAAGLATPGDGPTSSVGWISLPPAVGAAILAAWVLGLFGLWFVVLHRADINE
jgi:hypothetical protein